ncbi:hypothetical protein EYM_00905 [Ignicoccus islandicus DSM 13165]|uniref:Uncharacterized protein n=1 Tax=Ignicoccus islandicus DSM 13165 TaxID=940295 RepID=A0A0U3DXC5_9CREN|nr:hypothetical protein EYM_00905 [Ignicoccus islandicus DSM 13165]
MLPLIVYERPMKSAYLAEMVMWGHGERPKTN